MGIFSGYLLASDADGTLFGHDGVISPRNIEAVKQFTEQGGKFVLSTGRTADAARFAADALAINAPSVLSNGTQLYDFSKGEAVYECHLSELELAAAKSVFISNKFPFSGTELHSKGYVYVFNPTPESDEHETREGLKTIMDCPVDEVDSVYKALVTMRDEEEFAELEAYIQGQPGAPFNITHSTATFGEIKYHYLEMLPHGASKAVMLKELVSRLGIEPDHILAIGDYYNDLPMLHYAAITAVPNEAPQDIKEIADYIVCDCRQGAVGDFIERLQAQFSK